MSNPRYMYVTTFDQHHTVGVLKGLTTRGTLAFGSESAVEQWHRGVKRHVDRNGYDVFNVTTDRVPFARYMNDTYGAQVSK